MHCPHRTVVALTVAASCGLLQAQAQPQLPDRKPDTLEPVVVFGSRELRDGKSLDKSAPAASRLGLTVKETPAAVDVIDQSTLQDRGVNTLADSARAMTGVSSSVRPGAGPVFSSRGFVDNGLGVLFDGIRIGGATITMRNYDAFNFDRIDVVRGPASVLYGEGAGAGALNFVRRAPKSGPLQSEVLAQIGSDDQLRIGGAVAGSVASSTDISLAYSRNQIDGPADEQESRFNHWVAAVRQRLTNEVALFAEIDYLKNKVDNAYWGTPLVNGQLAPQLARKNYNLAPDNRFDDEVRWVRGGIEARLGGVLSGLDYKGQVFSYDSDRDWKNLYAFSSTNVPGRIQPRAVENLAYDHSMWGTRHEVSGEQFGGASRTSVGIEYQDTDFSSPRSTSANRPNFDPFNPQPVIFDNFGLPRVDSRRAQVDQVAVFAENRYAITPALKLVSGLRYNRLDADIARPDASIAFNKSFNYTDGRIGAVWDVTSATATYASFATGREPIESLFIFDPSQKQFDLTRYRLFEMGVKSGFAAGRGEFTAAIYDLTREDIPTADPNVPGAFAQAGEQSSRGIEVSIAFRPLDTLLLEANAALLKAEFDTVVNFVGGVGAIAAGNKPANVPEQLFNAFITWRMLPAVTLGAQLQYVGDRQANAANTLTLPSYTTADLWGRYAFARRTDLTLRVRNVADKQYVDWASSGFGQTNVYYAAERRYELTLRTAF